jgi:hypothetical protein
MPCKFCPASSHAVDPLGKIASNPCKGVKHLYAADRSEIIWTDSDITQVKRPARRRSRTPLTSPGTPACGSAI